VIVAAAATTKSATTKASKKKVQSSTGLIPESLRGYACVLGGALAHLTFGSVYCWGNFQSYSPLNLRFFDGKEHPGAQPDALLVMPAFFLGQCLAMPCGPLVVQRLGPRNTLLLGAYIMAAGVFGASYATSLLPFLVLYGVMFGAGVGLAYTSPMIAGWAWMPQAKGLVSGAILAGFGAGGYVFNMIGSAIANPKKLNPVGGKFPAEVYAGFPNLLRTLAAIYATLATAGALLITVPPKPATTAKKAKPVEVPGVAVGAAVQSRQFWTMWLMIIASASAGLNVASMFKQFAATQPALTGDAYQVTVGAMGTLFNGVGRLFWGSLSDKIGFKASFTVLTLAQAAVQLLYNQSGGSKPTFLAANCVAWFCLAGTFAMMPPAIQRMFGPKYGALIYGLVYSAFGVASVGSTFLSKALVASFGWEGVFKVLAAVSVFATVLTSTLTPLVSLPSSSV
jgi:OFA family oxalate/formate antiporter-like MFS transporter